MMTKTNQLTTKENNALYVSNTKHWHDILQLALKLTGEENVKQHTPLIVNVQPQWSSITAQVLGHKLSYLHQDQVLDLTTLEVPLPTDSQVWDGPTQEYVPFDHHLKLWLQRHRYQDTLFLFVTSHTDAHMGRHLQKIFNGISRQTETQFIHFTTVYLHEESQFVPSTYVQKYKGNIIYEWENVNSRTL